MPLLIVELIRIAKVWKQPKTPLTHEERKCDICVYYMQQDAIFSFERMESICINLDKHRWHDSTENKSNRKTNV